MTLKEFLDKHTYVRITKLSHDKCYEIEHYFGSTLKFRVPLNGNLEDGFDQASSELQRLEEEHKRQEEEKRLARIKRVIKF